MVSRLLSLPLVALTLLVGARGLGAQEILWTPEDAQTLRTAQGDLEQGQVQRALASLDELLLRYPHSPVVQRLRGHALLSLGRPQPARDALGAALAGGAFHIDVLGALFRIDYEAGHLPAALSSARLALLLEPDQPQWALAYGDLLLEGGQFAAAEVIYDHLFRAGDPSPALLERLGQTALSAGRRDEALAWLESAYYLGSTDSDLAQLLAVLWIEAGDPMRAEVWSERAGDVGRSERTLAAIGRAFRRGDLKAAETSAVALEAQGSPSERAQAAAWRGRIARIRGNEEEASTHFKRAIEDGLVDADVLGYLGARALWEKRAAEALGFLGRAWDLEPKNSLLPLLIRAALEAEDTERCDRYLVAYIEHRGLDQKARTWITQRAQLSEE